MRKTFVFALCVVFAIASFSAVAEAKKSQGKSLGNYNFTEMPQVADVPGELVPGVSYASSAVDTFLLGWWGFDVPITGGPQGWTAVDITAQLGFYFHVADATELDGGTFGNLLPLTGAGGSQSLWLGQDDITDPSDPDFTTFCGYSALPGYGNNWQQTFTTKALTQGVYNIEYDVFFDSEPGYDQTVLEFFDANAGVWTAIAGVNSGAGLYDGTGATPSIHEGPFATNSDCTAIRFSFGADGAWSDEDGLWPTDGAIILDNIVVTGTDADSEDFEGEAVGSGTTDSGYWSAGAPPGFGQFATIIPGFAAVQEDDCFTQFNNMWSWFDDVSSTNYACGGHPTQGAMPYGPINGLYMNNEIWSPVIPNDTGLTPGTGVYNVPASGSEYLLSFLSYRDLPLDNLQFYIWSVRSIIAGCPGQWKNDNFVFFGGQKDWIRTSFSIGAHIDAGAGDSLQVSVGSVDACGFWCGIFGTGACHSHAPLIDEVALRRVDTAGPQIIVRHLDLFQDNFAGDGTLTGTARADIANDIAPGANSGSIVPGDSLTFTANDPVLGVGLDTPDGTNTNTGPSVYAYFAVGRPGGGGPTGAALESPDLDAGDGVVRFPVVGSVVSNGRTWTQVQMDSAETTAGAVLANRWAVDIADDILVPGDTIYYALAATSVGGITNYYHRTLKGQGGGNVTNDLDEALADPMEFSILPQAGDGTNLRDILYVDDTDDRGGPSQLFFDTAFDFMGILDQVDRYDVLGPSSSVANSLGSRVVSTATQIIGPYNKIIWSSGNLNSSLIGDGTGNPEKSPDFAVLESFLTNDVDDPGLYITGDGIATEWATLAGTEAINVRSTFMNFNVTNDDHVAQGEDVSPVLVAEAGGCFDDGGLDSYVAYGGCPVINQFDVLEPTGTAVAEFLYPSLTASDAAVIKQTTANGNGGNATVILEGHSFQYIRDDVPSASIPDRVQHMLHVIRCLGNIANSPSGVDPSPQFATRLGNPFPNPFNPSTKIEFELKERGHVSIQVYNVAGQLIKTLVNETRNAGAHTDIRWDGSNNAGQAVGSGVYFYKMVTTDFNMTKKMVLLK